MRNSERFRELLMAEDVLDEAEQAFKDLAQRRNPAWAMECRGDQLWYTREMARQVRPFIKRFDAASEEERSVLVHEWFHDLLSEFIGDGRWRANSTSMLRNAQTQAEAAALARLIDMLRKFV